MGAVLLGLCGDLVGNKHAWRRPVNSSGKVPEFLRGIVASSADGNIVRISPGLFQPIAADDVGAIVADVALAAPRNGIVEIAGPERAPFNEFVARYLKAIGDPRKVVGDPEARYFGGRVEERSLVPLGEARLGYIGFDEWLRRSQAAA
jgi:uncharacterized protein YbjT (DUF2867 family)